MTPLYVSRAVRLARSQRIRRRAPGCPGGSTAEVVLDAPDRVQRGLDGALDPGGGPGDVVSGEEDAALLRRQVVLHEVGVHPLVVPVVPGQRSLERAQEVPVGLPGHGDRVADDVAGDVDVGIDLVQRAERELNPVLDRLAAASSARRSSRSRSGRSRPAGRRRCRTGRCRGSAGRSASCSSRRGRCLGSLSFQNGRSTITNVLDDCM